MTLPLLKIVVREYWPIPVSLTVGSALLRLVRNQPFDLQLLLFAFAFSTCVTFLIYLPVVYHKLRQAKSKTT